MLESQFSVRRSSSNGTGVRSPRAAKAGKEFRELAKVEEVLQRGSELLVPFMTTRKKDPRVVPQRLPWLKASLEAAVRCSQWCSSCPTATVYKARDVLALGSLKQLTSICS